ncbi:hypothetical protein SDC9_31802 [bioreactor metagenome]|uniref:Uncharacterized protein n=1 Tax=bioreactor metagenome TaxID=1076179 RepID=A0A644V3B7_9ZZZZ
MFTFPVTGKYLLASEGINCIAYPLAPVIARVVGATHTNVPLIEVETLLGLTAKPPEIVASSIF